MGYLFPDPGQDGCSSTWCRCSAQNRYWSDNMSCSFLWNYIVQTAIPEAMVIPDKKENNISETGNTETFSAIGIGPGLGTESESAESSVLIVK